jgi:protein required for attachment to host cells
MSRTKIQHGDWVVVCDGRKALILENRGDEKFPNLRTKEVHEHEDPPTHALGTNTPTRVHASVGTARSSVEQADWHREAERLFLEKLAHRLGAAVTAGEVKKLAIIAAPRALGMLRSTYPAAVRTAIRLEMDKDLVRMPVHEIEMKLAAGSLH